MTDPDVEITYTAQADFTKVADGIEKLNASLMALVENIQTATEALDEIADGLDQLEVTIEVA